MNTASAGFAAILVVISTITMVDSTHAQNTAKAPNIGEIHGTLRWSKSLPKFVHVAPCSKFTFTVKVQIEMSNTKIPIPHYKPLPVPPPDCGSLTIVGDHYELPFTLKNLPLGSNLDIDVKPNGSWARGGYFVCTQSPVKQWILSLDQSSISGVVFTLQAPPH